MGRTGARVAVLAHLRRCGPADEVELVVDLRMPPAVVAAALDDLAASGAVRAERHGAHTLHRSA